MYIFFSKWKSLFVVGLKTIIANWTQGPIRTYGDEGP